VSLSLKEVFCLLRLEAPLNPGLRHRSIASLFRLAAYAHYGPSPWKYIFKPVSIFYRLYTEFFLGIELPAKVIAGPGLRIVHGVGLVVHKNVVLGKNCTLRQCVTIGNKGALETEHLVPIIGDNVEFGAGAIVIGGVTIGDNSIIGAGVVVTKDVPPNSIVVGESPRILPRKRAS
jgi:putative colanic acid biosynthesis acetyltransferase WcaB